MQSVPSPTAGSLTPSNDTSNPTALGTHNYHDLPSLYQEIDRSLTLPDPNFFQPKVSDLESIPSILTFLSAHRLPQLLQGEYTEVTSTSSYSLLITSSITAVPKPARPANETSEEVEKWLDSHRRPKYYFQAVWKESQSHDLPMMGKFYPTQSRVDLRSFDGNRTSHGTIAFIGTARSGQLQLTGQFDDGRKHHVEESPITRRRDKSKKRDVSSLRQVLSLNMNALVNVRQAALGSPIQNQDATTLAVVCRFLTLQELLNSYRSCRLLRDATSHPLTFQHDLRIGVDPWTGAFVRGPSGSFAILEKFQAAIRSRPFKGNLRNLTLGSHTIPCAQLLREMLNPDAPSLRSLHLFTVMDNKNEFNQLITGRPTSESSNSSNQRTITHSPAAALSSALPMSEWPSMQFLRVLHLDLFPDAISMLRACIPKSLEILQLTFHCSNLSKVIKHQNDHFRLPKVYDDDLVEIVSSGRNLRQLVVQTVKLQDNNIPRCQDCAKKLDFSTACPLVTNLGDLKILQQLSKLEQLEYVHWLIKVPLLNEMSEFKQSVTPVFEIPKVPSLLLFKLNCEPSSKVLLSYFPSLVRLNMCEFFPPPLIASCPTPWPEQLVMNLQELVVENIRNPQIESSASKADLIDPYQQMVNIITAAGTWPSLTRLSLNRYDSHSTLISRVQLDEFFQSMPQLTDLSLKGAVAMHPHSYAKLPRLQTLRDFTWPYIHDKMDQFHASDFPALTSLQVVLVPELDGTATYRPVNSSHNNLATYIHLLQQIPSLKALKWLRSKFMDPHTVSFNADAETARAAQASFISLRPEIDYAAASTLVQQIAREMQSKEISSSRIKDDESNRSELTQEMPQLHELIAS